jgi:hypothetical protein
MLIARLFSFWTRNGHATTDVSIVKYAFGRRFVLAEVGIIATRP